MPQKKARRAQFLLGSRNWIYFFSTPFRVVFVVSNTVRKLLEKIPNSNQTEQLFFLMVRRNHGQTASALRKIHCMRILLSESMESIIRSLQPEPQRYFKIFKIKISSALIESLNKRYQIFHELCFKTESLSLEKVKYTTAGRSEMDLVLNLGLDKF